MGKAYKMKGLPGLARYMTVYRRGDLLTSRPTRRSTPACRTKSTTARLVSSSTSRRRRWAWKCPRWCRAASSARPPRACGARAEVAVQRALPEACPGERCHQERGEEEGQKANVKRVPPGPRPGKLVSGEVCVLEAQPYTENYF